MNVIERIKREPVLVSYAVALGISVAAGFGFDLDPGYIATIDAALGLGAAIFARQRVAPVSRLSKMKVEELAEEFAEALVEE